MWILPSLNRFDQLQALLARIAETGGAQPGLVILGPYQHGDVGRLVLPPGWLVSTQHQADTCLTEVFNRFFRDHPDLPWYGMISDDHWPVTQGWAAALERAAARGIGSCNDGWQAPVRMHSPTIWRGDVLRACGWWNPPMLKHSYADDWWEYAGRALGLWTCDMATLVEHRHHNRAGAAADETYRRQEQWMAEDRAAFSTWTRTNDFRDTLARLRRLKATAPRDAALAPHGDGAAGEGCPMSWCRR